MRLNIFQKLLLLFPCLIFTHSVFAQEVSGSVADRANSALLSGVEITNTSAGKKVESNAKGAFTISARAGQVLTFYQPGYLSDTLLLVNTKPIKRYLYLNNNFLKNVTIKGEVFNPEVTYADVYQKAMAIKVEVNKPFIFYPSKYFSKAGKRARKFKRYLEREKSERKIDARFNDAAVAAMTPLKGEELDYFMMLYRPTLKQLSKLDKQGLMFYIMNSFTAFKALPIEKRTSPLQQYLKQSLQPDTNNKRNSANQNEDQHQGPDKSPPGL